MGRRLGIAWAARLSCGAAAAACALVLSGCGPNVDLKTVLQVSDVATGWRDAGIVQGKNKIVPSITFRLRRSTDRSLEPLALNLAFKRLAPSAPGRPPSAASEEQWDDVYIATVTFNGNETAPLSVVSDTGYTADPPQSRADMLKHSQFRDMRVHLFARHGAAQWVELGQYDISRQLLPR
ncbi:MAG: hypothetical protein DMF85_19310 [Acidobacteria bacterium]|nr:MAG: hypothetical protein DMF85_19310 [Acidobacteriota bacterium]PYR74579.1 MAG: hypothetical protein DMF86_18040 [Acidobacteriota bacterium]